MKNLSTLSAVLLCSLGAAAQSTQNAASSIGKPSVPAKTTATEVRLISSSNFTSNGSGFDNDDSTIYRYSGSNGYDDLTKGWKYDSTIVWVWDNTSSTWKDDGRSYKHIPAGQVLSYTEKIRVGGVWESQSQSVYTYKNGLIETSTHSFNMGSGLAPLSKDSNIYNSAKQRTESIMQNWDATNSTWLKASRQTYHFNTAGKIDTIWYDSWLGGTWKSNMRTVNVYNAGLLVTAIDEGYSGTTWANFSRTNYTYNAQSLMATSVQEAWNTGTSAWQNGQRIEMDYNVDGDMIEQRFSIWNSGAWQYGQRAVFTYNSHHHVLTENTYSWNAGSSSWVQTSGVDVFRRNIYETFTADVKTISADKLKVEVFPVPATDKINISVSFKEPQYVVVRMLDLRGKLVKQISQQAGAYYRSSIDVSDIPAGNYLLNISGTTEAASTMITIAN